MTENKGWTAARIGQDLRQGGDRDPIDESPSHWWISFIDDRLVLRGLLILKENYSREAMAEQMGVPVSEAPARAEQTKLFQQTFRTAAGMGIDRALRQSDVDRQSAMIGIDSAEDTSGTGKLLELIESIEEGYIGYLYGQMGSGKTDFAIYLSELWTRMHRGDCTLGSNVESFEGAETLKRYETLQDWVRDGDEPKLFVLDEASSSASGYAQDAHKVTNYFRRLLQSFRKERANILLIGHTGKDVHPFIRRQTNHCIEKPEKKRAVFYDGVNDNGEGVDEQFSLSGIETTSLEYDSKEMSDWYWES